MRYVFSRPAAPIRRCSPRATPFKAKISTTRPGLTLGQQLNPLTEHQTEDPGIAQWYHLGAIAPWLAALGALWAIAAKWFLPTASGLGVGLFFYGIILWATADAVVQNHYLIRLIVFGGGFVTIAWELWIHRQAWLGIGSTKQTTQPLVIPAKAAS